MATEVKTTADMAPTRQQETGTPAATPEEDDSEQQYPGRKALSLILLAIYLTMFLAALDRTIIGTAIPKITDDFHSINDVGWYAAAFLLTTSAFQLIYGRIYSFYSPKWVLIGSIILFEVGSTVCAAAPTSVGFIIGRAVAGFGSAGIMAGVINIMVISVPLHRRPLFQGLFGAVFGVASVAGPLLGGVFTTDVTWRWCFWINLPIGGAVILILVFILKHVPSKDKSTLREQFLRLDPMGTLVFLPGVICLLLALQWGGTTYAWKNARIIVLFILAGLLLITFAYIQYRVGENATVPLRIISQRSVAAGAYCSFWIAGSMMTIIYYLPFWFQAIKGVSAVKSGIDLIPLILSLVVASIIGGILTNKTGYYVPQLILSCVMMSIATGLITTLQTDTGHPKWIGYQIFYGLGLGFGLQQNAMAAQTVLKNADVMIGVALMFFFQGLGGSIFVSVAQTVFTHSLVRKLQDVGTKIDPHVIVNTGATEIRSLVPKEQLPQVLVAYNNALMDTFKVALACSCVVILGALAMEWKSVKGKKEGGGTNSDKKASDEETVIVKTVENGELVSEKSTEKCVISGKTKDEDDGLSRGSSPHGEKEKHSL